LIELNSRNIFGEFEKIVNIFQEGFLNVIDYDSFKLFYFNFMKRQNKKQLVDFIVKVLSKEVQYVERNFDNCLFALIEESYNRHKNRTPDRKKTLEFSSKYSVSNNKLSMINSNRQESSVCGESANKAIEVSMDQQREVSSKVDFHPTFNCYQGICADESLMINNPTNQDKTLELDLVSAVDSKGKTLHKSDKASRDNENNTNDRDVLFQLNENQHKNENTSNTVQPQNYSELTSDLKINVNSPYERSYNADYPKGLYFSGLKGKIEANFRKK
jgi:hypothetical protein